jgi:hypothetical protein
MKKKLMQGFSKCSMNFLCCATSLANILECFAWSFMITNIVEKVGRRFNE